MSSDYRTISASVRLAVMNVHNGFDNTFSRIKDRYALVVLHICNQCAVAIDTADQLRYSVVNIQFQRNGSLCSEANL